MDLPLKVSIVLALGLTVSTGRKAKSFKTPWPLASPFPKGRMAKSFERARPERLEFHFVRKGRAYSYLYQIIFQISQVFFQPLSCVRKLVQGIEDQSVHAIIDSIPAEALESGVLSPKALESTLPRWKYII